MWEIGPGGTDIKKIRSFLYHRACIWDVVFLPCGADSLGKVSCTGDRSKKSSHQNTKKLLPSGTFVTCSADNTLRFWNTDEVSKKKLQDQFTWSSVYSNELLHTIHLDVPAVEDKMICQAVRSSGESLIYSTDPERHEKNTQDGLSSAHTLSSVLPDTEIPDRPDSAGAPRSLAAHPSSPNLAVGDRAGRVRVIQLETMTQTQCINAHDAEVLTLQYTPTLNYPLDATGTPGVEAGSILLASAGRDRLVHVFRADEPTEDYEPLTTLDNHSSSVTAMIFTVMDILSILLST